MPFEPDTRIETWIFVRVGSARLRNPRYRRARFNYVEYDGNPDRYMEPVSACELADITGTVSAFNKHRGIIGRAEYYDQNPVAELHDFSDVGL